ncbi:MAG TPA: ATP-binding protein, partial [Chloroflexota bacterium]|nr:ATP-binding protein [Chloroflexota bacterium]
MALLFVVPAARETTPPNSAGDWLILAVTTLTAVYLGLRPLQVAPDRRITAASAPVIALALLFDARTAVLAAGGAALVCHAVRRAAWHVTAFNVAQRASATAVAAWICGAGRFAPELPFFVPCTVAAAAYFLANTTAVSAISASRKGRPWATLWRAMMREQFVGEAALLACGVLFAIHAHSAPLTLPVFIPPLWLAWRVLAGAAENRRLNASLKEALDQQKAFVANASHELRTPIASLRAQLEMLRGQVAQAPREELTAKVDQLAYETARIGALLSDLLALTRADAGLPLTRERVDLEDVLLDAYRDLRPLAGRVNLSVHLEDEHALTPVVIGDHERLRQLLLNLGANALRFTPPEGSVEIRCAVTGQRVCVHVRDTGAGIAPEDQPRIFDRFYRADPGRARDS